MSDGIHRRIVVDENNKPLEVIISYDEWLKIENMITKTQKIMTREKLSKYIGIVNLKEDPLEYQKRIRSRTQHLLYKLFNFSTYFLISNFDSKPDALMYLIFPKIFLSFHGLSWVPKHQDIPA